ncbi:MAG: gamma-glutamyl-phosphate reductase, partial [Pseudomonadota bacterium]|nr:gamma-glutamyl-phosphate reductase [Pseudomonadota bacterium]
MSSNAALSASSAQTSSESNVIEHVVILGRSARRTSAAMAAAGSRVKDAALQRLAHHIRAQHDQIKAANSRDLQRAHASNVSPPLLDRLTLDDEGIEQMAIGVEQVMRLPDPVGEIIEMKPRPSGLQVGRMRVPLGVV